MAAVLNPGDADGLGRAHGLTGEVEGSVSGDIHALGLPGKVGKSCQGTVKGRTVSNQQTKAEP